MLENLENINWKKLTHAYGSAEDVPSQIRDLASSDQKIRKAAMWNLYGNIFHQGTRYQASAYAVPLLLELLKQEHIEQKEEIVLLLVHLALGYPEEYVPDGFSIEPLKKEMSLYSNPEESELVVWAIDAYEAVSKGVNVFQSLLFSQDEKVRISAIYALAWFLEEADTSTNLLREFLKQERSKAEKTHALLTLGILDGHLKTAQDLSLFQNFMYPPSPRVTQVAAALALVHVSRDMKEEKDVSQAMAILLEVLGDPNSYQKQEAWFLFMEGNVVDYVAKMLQSLGPFQAQQAIPALYDTLSQAENVLVSYGPTAALCKLIFQDFKITDEMTFSQLTVEQQKLLKVLAIRDKIWMFNEEAWSGNFSMLLANYGIPSTPRKLRAFLKT